MPFTSDTDGVYGNDVRPPSIQVSFQSSSERNEPRGAAGFARMRFQASSLTATSDMPGGPARHFCGPATQMSRPQSSGRSVSQPSDDTTSAITSAPWRCAIGPISETGLIVPDGVSECTTASTSASGCAANARSTISGSTCAS